MREVGAGHLRGQGDVLLHQLHGERGIVVAVDHAHRAAVEVRRVRHAAAVAIDVVVRLRIHAELRAQRE